MWATQTETVIRQFRDTFDADSGTLDTTTRWTILDAGTSPDDIDATTLPDAGGVIRMPTTADVEPTAFIQYASLQNPLTCRISLSVRLLNSNTAGAGRVQLYRPDETGNNRFTARVGIHRAAAGAGNPDTFQFVWRGQATTFAVAGLLSLTWYRIGMEVDAAAGVARGYLNTTALTSPDEMSDADAGLSPYASFTIDSGSRPYDDNTIFAGLEMGGTATPPSTDFTSCTGLLIQEWRLPFTPSTPAGAFFTTLDDTYAVYKTSMTLHERLNRAQLV